MLSVAVVGDKGVGKSTLISSLVGREIGDNQTVMISPHIGRGSGTNIVAASSEYMQCSDNPKEGVKYTEFPHFAKDSDIGGYSPPILHNRIILFVTTAENREFSVFKALSEAAKSLARPPQLLVVVNRANADTDISNLVLNPLFENVRIFRYDALISLLQNVPDMRTSKRWGDAWRIINSRQGKELGVHLIDYDADRLKSYITKTCTSTTKYDYPQKFHRAYDIFTKWREPGFADHLVEFTLEVSELLKNGEDPVLITKMLGNLIGNDTPWVNSPSIYYVQGMGIMIQEGKRAYRVEDKWRFLPMIAALHHELFFFCAPYMDSITLVTLCIEQKMSKEGILEHIKMYPGKLLHPWSVSMDLYNKFRYHGDVMIPNMANYALLDSIDGWLGTKRYILEKVVNLNTLESNYGYLIGYIINPEVTVLMDRTPLDKDTERTIKAISYRFKPLFTEKIKDYNAYKYNIEANSEHLLLVEKAMEPKYVNNNLCSNKVLGWY